MSAHPAFFAAADRQRAALAAEKVRKAQALDTGLHVVPTELDRTLADFRRNTAILEEILDDPDHPQHNELEAIVELNWPGGAA